MKVKMRFYDLRNKPKIEEKGQVYEIDKYDLHNDCSDCVHVVSPITGEIWRFYYRKEGTARILDEKGVIQL